MNRQRDAYHECWGRRKLFLAAGVLAALGPISKSYLWAQDGRTQTNTAPAILRINVRVVPVATLSPQRAKDDSGAGVTYSIPATPPPMTVSEEIRPLPMGNAAGISHEDAVLKTLTVVAR